MSTLIVSVEDATMLTKIKAAIEQLRGVVSVTDGVSYDATDCDAYREAMEDVKAGRVYKASSVEEIR
ncbi:MAG: hypothetical protein MJY74_08590 [Bacteroidaceae bacterium]|nr:hypothetical protein [Bacteroidaceae bacterium]